MQPENKTNYQGVWQKERKTEMKEGEKRGKKRKEKASINPEQITSSGVTSPLSGSYCPQKPEASVSGALAQGRDGKPRAWEDGKLCWETITFHKLRSETQNPRRRNSQRVRVIKTTNGVRFSMTSEKADGHALKALSVYSMGTIGSQRNTSKPWLVAKRRAVHLKLHPVRWASSAVAILTLEGDHSLSWGCLVCCKFGEHLWFLPTKYL